MLIHMVEHGALVLLDVAAEWADIVAVVVLDIRACGDGHDAGCGTLDASRASIFSNCSLEK